MVDTSRVLVKHQEVTIGIDDRAWSTIGRTFNGLTSGNLLAIGLCGIGGIEIGAIGYEYVRSGNA